MAWEKLLEKDFLNRSVIKILGEGGTLTSNYDFIFYIFFSLFLGFLVMTLIHTILPKNKEGYLHWKNEASSSKTIISFLIGASSLLVVNFVIELINIFRIVLDFEIVTLPYLFIGVFSIAYSYLFYLLFINIKKGNQTSLISYRWVFYFIIIDFVLIINLALIGTTVFFIKYIGFITGTIPILFLIIIDSILILPLIRGQN